MIVANQQQSIEYASEITNKLIHTINEETKKFNDEGDAAETIYLIVHTIGILNAKICLSLVEFAKIYGFEVTIEQIRSWIELITTENISLNK